MTIAWSFSRLQKYRQCQLKSFYMDYAPKHDRVKQPYSEVLEKGKAWHTDMERAIRNGAPLPPHLLQMSPIVAALRAFPTVYVEYQLAFDENLNVVDWFADNVWCRVIWDVAAVTADQTEGIVGDHKTGKVRPDSDQLDLFAASMLTRLPSLARVHTNFYFMEHRQFTWHTVDRKAVDHIWNKFGEEAYMIQRSVETGNWEPNPSPLCKWCPVPKSKCSYSEVDDSGIIARAC